MLSVTYENNWATSKNVQNFFIFCLLKIESNLQSPVGKSENWAL